jgi:hypothetical protein
MICTFYNTHIQNPSLLRMQSSIFAFFCLILRTHFHCESWQTRMSLLSPTVKTFFISLFFKHKDKINLFLLKNLNASLRISTKYQLDE